MQFHASVTWEGKRVPEHNWELLHKSCAANAKQEKRDVALNSYAYRLLTAA